MINWIKKGLLNAYQLPGRGDHRVQKQDYLDFLNQQNIPIPKELKSNHVLIIEDSQNDAYLLSELFTQCGYQAEVSNNGFEIGEKLAVLHPELITLDINMPLINGYEVLEYLNNHHEFSKIPVIVISSYPSNQIQNKLVNPDVKILQKPVHIEMIKETVLQLNKSDLS